MKTITVIIINLMVCCISLRSQTIPDSVKFRSLEPNEFHLQYLKEHPALLIDVRESFEFRGKRIKGAVNIPSSGNPGLAADTINKECALFFYCTSGYRSTRVAKSFYDRGFRELYSLEGGLGRWKKEGMKVEKRRKDGKNKVKR